MKIKGLRKYDGKNKTRAFFSIETDEGIVIKNFKLTEGDNGLFMSNPSSKSKKDGKWYEDVWIPQEQKDELEKLAIDEYGGPTSSTSSKKPYPF